MKSKGRINIYLSKLYIIYVGGKKGDSILNKNGGNFPPHLLLNFNFYIVFIDIFICHFIQSVYYQRRHVIIFTICLD